MNSFRSYKLKLSRSESEEPQSQSDEEHKTHHVTDNKTDDFTEYPAMPTFFPRQNTPMNQSTLHNPMWQNFGMSRFAPLFPVNPFFHSVGQFPRIFPQSGYCNFRPFQQGQRYGEVPPLIYIPPRKFNELLLSRGETNTFLPSGKTDIQENSFEVKKDQQKPRLRIDGVAFGDGDETKKTDSKSKKVRNNKNKVKANRKRSLSKYCHLKCDKSEGCFRCHYCSRTFSYICHMKVHERVHTGEKPYSCQFCNHQFSQLGSLTVHMRIHTGAKPYQCGECWKKFRHVNSLRRHQRQVHSMTTEQIARSIDKVTDVMYAKKQLPSTEKSPTAEQDVPFDFKSALKLCPIPFQWNRSNGMLNQTYKIPFIFGRSNEPTVEGNETMDTSNKSKTTHANRTVKKKASHTWRPFVESTDKRIMTTKDMLDHSVSYGKIREIRRNSDFKAAKGIDESPPSPAMHETVTTDKISPDTTCGGKKNTDLFKPKILKSNRKEHSSDGETSTDEYMAYYSDNSDDEEPSSTSSTSSPLGNRPRSKSSP